MDSTRFINTIKQYQYLALDFYYYFFFFANTITLIDLLKQILNGLVSICIAFFLLHKYHVYSSVFFRNKNTKNIYIIYSRFIIRPSVHFFSKLAVVKSAYPVYSLHRSRSMQGKVISQYTVVFSILTLLQCSLNDSNCS